MAFEWKVGDRFCHVRTPAQHGVIEKVYADAVHASWTFPGTEAQEYAAHIAVRWWRPLDPERLAEWLVQ